MSQLALFKHDSTVFNRYFKTMKVVHTDEVEHASNGYLAHFYRNYVSKLLILKN